MAQFRSPTSATDTIVAVSTPRGAGAIAIVRLSGEQAPQVALRLFAPGAPPLTHSHRLVRRRLTDAQGATLDDALVALMRGPNSYTGQDVVELHLHGSPAVVDAVLQACLGAGARLAEPGEYTRRAFLSGRLDLAQAEGVGALVGAESEQQRRAALQLVEGQLGGALRPALHAVEGVVAAWRAALDFPDEVDADGTLAAATAALHDVARRLTEMVRQARPVAAAAPQVVLLGDANVGKSTLLNALAGEERALVDAAPGTTRDAVSAAYAAAGGAAVLWDTAGLRARAEGVEARGVALAHKKAENADLCLWLTGAAGALWPEASLAKGPSGNAVLVVGSQADRTSPEARARIEAEAQARGLPFVGWICAPTGEGLDTLRAALEAHLRGQNDIAGARFALTHRHRTLLTQAADALEACLSGLRAGVPLDLALADLELVGERMGQILGRDVDAAVLDRIFADFCLGK